MPKSAKNDCARHCRCGTEIEMPNEKRGIFTFIEVFIDMIINLLSILMGYLLVMMINWGEEINNIYITHPVALIIIFANVLCASFVYLVFNFYKPNRYLRNFKSFPLVFKGNFIYFGSLAVITAFVCRPGYRQIILFWIFFTAFLSTSFLTFKRHVIRLTLQLLRKKQYHLIQIRMQKIFYLRLSFDYGTTPWRISLWKKR